MSKQFAILHTDRHFDTRVFLVTCSEDEIEKYIKQIWDSTYSYEPTIKFQTVYSDSAGDRVVEVVEVKNIS